MFTVYSESSMTASLSIIPPRMNKVEFSMYISCHCRRSNQALASRRDPSGGFGRATEIP